MTTSKLTTITGALIFACCASSAYASEAVSTNLQTAAKVSKADAQATALAKVPAGTVSSAELEKEHGKLIWSFDIAKAGSKNITEIQVDAMSGKIISSKEETPQKEADEAIEEAKEAPKK